MRIASALFAVLFVVLFHCPADASTPSEQPNVVVILVDDMGFSDVGCYGGEIKTPNLDRLAAGGLKYTQFYNTARCWPTRSALMTGYYAQQIRRDRIPGKNWGGGRGKRPAWAPLMSVALKQRGYRCYHSGKWHIDGKVLENGFDRSYRLNDHDRFFYPKNHLEDDKRLPPIAKGSGFYTTTHIADHTIKCWKDHQARQGAKPFFHFVAFTAPHFPLHAPEKDIEKYKGVYEKGWAEVRKSRWAKIKSLGLVNATLSEVERDQGPPYHFAKHLEKLGSDEVNRPVPWDQLTADQKKFQISKMMIHAAMVDRIDQEIGRLIAQLKSMKKFENTLIMFLSDNGASAEIMVRGDGHNRAASMGSGRSYLCLGPGWSTTSNTPFRKHKTWVHEGGIATPLIVHWPNGIAARGQTRHAVGHVIDLWPTIMDVTEPQEQQNSAAKLDRKNQPVRPGKSLTKTFVSDHRMDRELWWAHEGHRAFRQGDWKLVAPKGKPWELYHLKVDRAETKDLSKKQPEIVERLAAQWKQHTERFIKQSRPDNANQNRKKRRNN